MPKECGLWLANDSRYSEIAPLGPFVGAGCGMGVTRLDIASATKQSASIRRDFMVTSNSVFTLEYQYEDLKES